MIYYLKELWLAQWRGCLFALKKFRKRYWLGFFLTAIVALIILPFDSALLNWIRQPDNETLSSLARNLGKYGDIWPATLLLALTLWIFGLLSKKQYFIRVALCCLCAAVFAGATVNLLRPTLGRPRPKAELADGFYGPSLSHYFHGFPSGHSGAAFGTATSIAVAVPQVGVPMMLAAGAVGWSRLQINNHHPTDVLVGAAIGVAWGFAFGYGLRHGPVPAPLGKPNTTPQKPKSRPNDPSAKTGPGVKLSSPGRSRV